MRARRFLALLSTISFCVCAASGCASRPTPAPSPYVPASEAAAGWTEEGLASWYGGRDGFDGKPTASGEIYDSSLLTAAHRDLPLGTVAEVTNMVNGESVRVRINDRGPFVRGRIIDLSRAAAREIGLLGPGVGEVRLTVVSPGLERELASSTGLWTVQVGSFADRARAERHAERVRVVGLGAFLEPYRGLSRVKIGPFDSRKEAEQALEGIEDAGFEGIVVPADGEK